MSVLCLCCARRTWTSHPLHIKLQVTWEGAPVFPSKESRKYPSLGSGQMPDYPEGLDAARRRFVHAVEQASNLYCINMHVVAITHGPALDSLVCKFAGEHKMAVPELCGMLHLQNKGGWFLTGTTGVTIVD